MEHRSSFSQHQQFEQCPRCWYYSHIEKIKVIQDMCYADAGKCIHECLELYYRDKTKTMEEIKEYFYKNWKEKKLNESILKDKTDKYFLMIINGINLNINITSTEFTIFYPEIVGHLDGINTLNEADEIYDWKSSSQRTEENMFEYKKQMMLYGYLYYRKFNRLPKKIIVYYLAINNSNQEYIITPTINDIIEAEDWYFSILNKMKHIKEHKIIPPKCIDEGKECHFFCPYKDLCLNNHEGNLSINLELIGNYIKINGPITPLLHKGIGKKFSYELKNAHFIKKHRPDYDCIIRFWNEGKQILPIGFYKELLVTLQHYAEHKKLKLELQITDRRKLYEKNIIMPDKFINGKELREYQIKAVEAYLREKISILELATGAGKTEIAIEIIRRLGCKTLFIVDKIELLKQAKTRLEESLGITVGMIGHGVDDMQDVTVATVQTLTHNLKKYTNYLSTIQFAIFDECHKVAAKSYWKIAHYLINTTYRLGLSGTAFRDDGEDMYINAITGYKSYELSAKTLIDSNWLVRPNINFYNVNLTPQQVLILENKSKEGLINETKDYSSYYENFIATNDIRNNLIKDIVEQNKGKKILILTKLIQHGQYLTTLTNGVHLYGNTNKEERKTFFEEFVKGTNNVLISTISIFSEGIDIPSLDIVINASANKGDVKSIQVLGRILRKSEGKEMATYYDFMDNGCQFFKKASKARIKALRREGHNVEVI